MDEPPMEINVRMENKESVVETKEEVMGEHAEFVEEVAEEARVEIVSDAEMNELDRQVLHHTEEPQIAQPGILPAGITEEEENEEIVEEREVIIRGGSREEILNCIRIAFEPSANEEVIREENVNGEILRDLDDNQLQERVHTENIATAPKRRKTRRGGQNTKCVVCRGRKRVQKIRDCGHKICVKCYKSLVQKLCPHCQAPIISILPPILMMQLMSE